MNKTIKIIVTNALIAALYVVLTLISYPFAFEAVQFRIAEILVLLCFFRKDYTIGLTLGCVIANLFSSLGYVDVLFGSLATLIACLGICFCKHLVVAVFFPIVVNGLVVGFELWQFLQADFVSSALFVALGEFVVLTVGYFIFLAIFKRPKLLEIISANQNLDWKF